MTLAATGPSSSTTARVPAESCVVHVLDREGYILEGSERGLHFGMLFEPEDLASGSVRRLLTGQQAGCIEGWRVAGTRRYWAQTSVLPLFAAEGDLTGFACVTHDLTESARRDVVFRRSEARFHAVMEYSAVGLALLDLEGRWLQVNRAICELLGYSTDELLALTFQELTHPDDLDADLQQVRSLVAGEISSYRLEKRYLHKNGETVWGLLAVSLVHASEEAPAYFISQIQDITHLKTVESQLHAERDKLSYTSLHDTLTGLPNRRKFETALAEAAPPNDAGPAHALCFLDLDRFKLVNDTAGHAAGDALLRMVAQKIAGAVRGSDLVARLGGDEFAIVLWRCSLERATEILTKLLHGLEGMQFVWEGRSHRVTASVGLIAIDPAEPAGMSMQRADVACYSAKNAGRNRLSVYESAHGTVGLQHRELMVASEIKRAIAADRFHLFAQRIETLHGLPRPYFEVLLRMKGVDGETIPPAEFIPAAERYDLMGDVDRWVLQEVLERRAPQLAQVPNLLLSVNLSAASLGDGRLLPTFLQLLADSPLRADQIVIEITETAMINDFVIARVLLERLREVGCKIALDDFGVGLSSFSYLRSFPVDVIKIDGSFVRNAGSTGLDQAIVKSIRGIASEIGAKTVAECVETEAISSRMRGLGIDFAQGFGVARPAPLECVWSPA